VRPAAVVAVTVAPTLRAPQSDDPALQDDGVEEHTVSRRDTRTTDDSSVGAASVIVIADPGSPTQAPVGDHGLPMRRSFTRPELRLPGTVVEVADATPPAPTHATLRPHISTIMISRNPKHVEAVAGAIVTLTIEANGCDGVGVGVCVFELVVVEVAVEVVVRVNDGLGVVDAVCVCVAVLVVVDEEDDVQLIVGDGEGVIVSEEVVLDVNVAVGDEVAVTVAVNDWLPVALAVDEELAVSVAVDDWLAVCDAVVEGLPVPVTVADWLPVALAVDEELAVSVDVGV